jgi:hypothetical protein
MSKVLAIPNIPLMTFKDQVSSQTNGMVTDNCCIGAPHIKTASSPGCQDDIHLHRLVTLSGLQELEKKAPCKPRVTAGLGIIWRDEFDVAPAEQEDLRGVDPT